jgi:hypothetical protein
MKIILRHAAIAMVCLLVMFDHAFAADRNEELKQEMWNSSDKDFKVVATPAKWANKSAIIIAQMHRFEYRQRAAVTFLKLNSYAHYRIKLNDKNAVNKYAEITFKTGNGRNVKMYVGFKVLKSDGREIIVDPKTAVKMEQNGSDGQIAYSKIAIPNLEPGDIMDYYLCEEMDYALQAQLEFFDPVIINLPQEYPVMKQKFQFKAKRRCYINVRSVNGAPELKLVNDEENDEQYYSLEDADREGLEDMKWLYPNRDVPTIKFRAAFAYGKALRQYDVLLDEPGEVKSKVTAAELADVTRTIVMTTVATSNTLAKSMKDYKGPKDNFEIAKAAYYHLRHEILDANESRLLANRAPYSIPARYFVNSFSTYLKSKDIPHDVIVTSPREISSIDDVIFENELDFLIRVKKGGEQLYFAPCSIYTVAGSIPAMFQGVDGYAFDGLVRSLNWQPMRVTIPMTSKEENLSSSKMSVKLSDDLTQVEVNTQRSLTGVDKLYSQYRLIDVYDAIAEDNKTFEPYEYEVPSKQKKQYEALKKQYEESRKTTQIDALKDILNNDYEFEAKDPANLVVQQLGRDDKSPAMVYSCTFKSEELVKKTGPNYLIDIGKLIEGQISIGSDAMNRDQNIYFPCVRSFRYSITMDIPSG